MKNLNLNIKTKDGFPLEDVFFLTGGYSKSISNSCGVVSLRYKDESDSVQINWPKQKLEYTTIGQLIAIKDNTVTAGVPITNQSTVVEDVNNNGIEDNFEDYIQTVSGKKSNASEAGMWWPLLLLGGLGLLFSTQKTPTND